MLRVAEQYSGSDTGRQRRANEDSLLVLSPLFVVADGMGGAQAGEVASRIAVEAFRSGLPDSAQPERALEALAQHANSQIHELSHANAEQAGMGTTLTAIWVGEREVAIAHVGDSRAYCLRDGELLRLTDDHSLVDELMRQGRLTPEEASEHPQRSVITRALGIEGDVDVDTRSFRGQAGDVYLICSDGLTTMVDEQQIAELLAGSQRLRDAGEALIAAANRAGGRDNITVILLRLEEVRSASAGEQATTQTDIHQLGDGDAAEQAEAQVPLVGGAAAGAEPAGSQGNGSAGTAGTTGGAPAARGRRWRGAVPQTAGTRPEAARRPRRAGAGAPPASRRRGGWRRARAPLAGLVVLALLAAGAYLALQNVYFIGTNDRGLVTLYEGVPLTLPGNLNLYSSRYVSGVSASAVSPQRRSTLLDHSLRSEASAGGLIRSLELGQLE
ncbi:MAG TPA: Stp1/IreP family PP2C-type Ser/Thr phosphatase [Solirubrobacteraceae bacterium]